MSGVRYYNQTAPFWDFVANLEEQGRSHPWFAHRGQQGEAAEVSDSEHPNPAPWWGAGFPFGPMPHRARFGPGRGNGRPNGRRAQATADAETQEPASEKEEVPEAGPSEPREVVFSDSENAGVEGAKRRPGARRGGRGGLGAGQGRRAPAGPFEPREVVFSDSENAQSGAEGMKKRGPGARRGGRGGLGAGRGRRAAAAAAAGQSESREAVLSDSENARSGAEGPKRGPGARRGGGGMGRGRGGPGGRGRGPCGQRGGPAGRGGPHAHAHGPHAHGPHAHGPHARGPHAHGPRQGPGGPGRRGGPGGFPFRRFGPFAAMFQNPTGAAGNGDENFTPEVDIFDGPESFVVHVSLPGAKKDDVGVNWDADKSELSIAGVVHRPGDEELLQNLALDERKVGAFERKVRLGSRANPAQVDIDAITARMEDGILRIDVPKLDRGYVEIKKVDIE